MAGVNIEYKGSSIATIPDTGSKTIKTQGKYCEGDIFVEYEAPQAGIPIDENSLLPLEFGIDSGGVFFSDTTGTGTALAFGRDSGGIYAAGGTA